MIQKKAKEANLYNKVFTVYNKCNSTVCVVKSGVVWYKAVTYIGGWMMSKENFDPEQHAKIVKRLEGEVKSFDIHDRFFAYYLNSLALGGFPFSPMDTPEIFRKFKSFEITIGVANYGKKETVGYGSKTVGTEVSIPSGAPVRLILSYLLFRVKNFGDRKIVLDNSFHSFLKTLGVKVNYEEGGSAEQYAKELVNLCNTYISIRKKDNPKGLELISGKNVFIVEDFTFWWGGSDKDESGAYIMLSEAFYEYALESSTPAVWSHLQQIKKSAFRIDLYFWLVLRTYTATKYNNKKKIPWGEAFNTFGLGQEDLTSFKKKFKREYLKLVDELPIMKGVMDYDRTHIYFTADKPIISEQLGLNKLRYEMGETDL